ncbi:MAG TPA: GDP-mannose 4,6-dehydratase [Thermoanaerobaculia bacterium]|jgi:GDP-4-dehydro-6-deoxy-D-mannose reductase|nr:GDP-mannose 4,6-dehydratase [Thermoanaerobaculia bacterium]
MRALITGISGFVGSHLAEYLQNAGAEVSGITRQSGACHGGVLLRGSILDEEFLRDAVERVDPTHAFHCAAVLAGSTGVYEANVTGTSNLLAAIRHTGSRPVVIVAGSSAVYGRPKSLPVDEDHPFAPLTAYGKSKVEQEMVARSYFLSHGMAVVVARTFNLIGPRQSPWLVASGVAQQVALAERGGPATVRVGNVTPRRDYTDVRDAVRAYAMLADDGIAGGVYNVCSGVSRPVQDAVDILIAESHVPIEVEVDSDRLKETEVEDQVGSFERLHAATGWRPEIAFEQSLRDLLDDWRLRVATEANR